MRFVQFWNKQICFMAILILAQNVFTNTTDSKDRKIKTTAASNTVSFDVAIGK